MSIANEVFVQKFVIIFMKIKTKCIIRFRYYSFLILYIIETTKLLQILSVHTDYL